MASQEEHWVAGARRGDRDAFRRLVEAHARGLFSLCLRITHDAPLAEDAVQEALFNAYRHLGDFDGRSAFRTWLHRIAVNSALEQMRRRKGNETVASDVEGDEDGEDFLLAYAEGSPGPDQHARGGEIRRHVEDQLVRMTLLERTAFVLRHAEGQSLQDISDALSINISACKQAIFRAVRKLRVALQPLR
jgi:RNA polymerase sigma-70 factor, ECF subfamily